MKASMPRCQSQRVERETVKPLNQSQNFQTFCSISLLVKSLIDIQLLVDNFILTDMAPDLQCDVGQVIQSFQFFPCR